jgi:L-aspartate oxidase
LPAEKPLDVQRADVAVVGAGAAGLYAAICAAREGARVALVSRSPLAASASFWAQGGIAAALATDDSVDGHLADTIRAGRGAARESAVRVLCEESPARVRDLTDLGVRFDADRDGSLALGLEGGHSARRIVHAGGSATGRRLTRQLSARAAVDPLIDVLEGMSANALWIHDERCVGLLAEPVARNGGDVMSRVALAARATLLATGGAAALWERTTNPRGAIGAGLTLAHSAGAALADLELIQFHPTALASSASRRDGFLLTEALRGEGALLVGSDGERFVDELAPRDTVALAIADRLATSGERAVGLDLRSVDLSRFPNVAAALTEAGFDARAEPVPVAPAAHYTMGGIATDLDGRSTVPGLYAVGECGCTGVHGANRLASNSLAECFVFAPRAVGAGLDEPLPAAPLDSAPVDSVAPVPPPESRRALSLFGGLMRGAEGLAELAEDPFPLARHTGRAALARAESRGAHQRVDRPEADPALDRAHFVVVGESEPRLHRWEESDDPATAR